VALERALGDVEGEIALRMGLIVDGLKSQQMCCSFSSKPMNSRSKLKEGVGLALGLFIGWGILLPVLGLFEWKFGLMAGALAAIVALLFYYSAALRAPDDSGLSKG
jgi:hypothetical protein